MGLHKINISLTAITQLGTITIVLGEKVTYDLRADRDQSKAAGTTDMADAIIAAL